MLCHAVEIVTAKKAILRGLWFGSYSAKATKGKSKKPRRVIVLVHGLGSSAFSMLHVVEKLVDKRTAVLTFNNRGHDVISRLSRVKGKSVMAGSAHEKFTECVDDINGALRFARAQKVKEIYLAGHSTGCQKSIYWASKGGRGVKGIILLAPVSDWAAEMKRSGKKKVARAIATARALVRRGRKHQLLPQDMWHTAIDAQRILSLCTPESTEEIFPYSLPKKKPVTLQRVRAPLLVLWAGKDEFADQSAEKIARWFKGHIRAKKFFVKIIPNVNHGFKGGEKNAARAIRQWIS